jgi:DNA-binding CsgD family transcriptional regulator
MLSKNDALCLLELIYSSCYCNTEEKFNKLIGKLGYLIPFDFAAGGLAQLDVNDSVISYKVVNSSFPVEWFDIYLRKKYYKIDPVFINNFNEFQVQYWTDIYNANIPPLEFLSLKNNFGLKDGYSHGVKSLKGTEGSLFSISCNSSVSRKTTAFHHHVEAILTQIIPHLHQALCRIEGHFEVKHVAHLSKKEIEVLNWIKQGKRSWDISVILAISERTVNFHIANIMKKLDAVTRPQAVANAIQLGLIDIEY